MSLMAQHSAVTFGRFGVIRTLMAIFLTVSLFVTSTAFFVYQSLASQLSQNTIDISAFADEATDDKGQPLPEDAFEGRALNILISGIDSRSNQGEHAHGDPEEFTNIFSDTTMVMHVSADRTRINTVSIPRDLMTWLAPCTDAEGFEHEERWGQFNSAFRDGAVTDDIAAGINCTKRTVEALSGLTIDAFMVVDFRGFVGLVDALGGVWYDVETRIYDEQASADLEPGCQLLNGAQALSYARVRKSVGDGSDLGRMGRQQKLVAAMMREALSKNYITDLPKLLSFVQQGIESVKTSPNLANLNTDIGLLLSLASIQTQNIQFITLPNQQYELDINRVVVDELKAEGIWRALERDMPFPQNIEVTTGAGTKALTAGDDGQSALIPVVEDPLTSEAADEDAESSAAVDPSAPESAESTGGSAPTPPPAPKPCGPNR